MINAVNEGSLKSKDAFKPDKKDVNDNQYIPGKNNYELFEFPYKL